MTKPSRGIFGASLVLTAFSAGCSVENKPVVEQTETETVALANHQDVVGGLSALIPASPRAGEDAPKSPVGLSFFFRDGSAAPVQLVGDEPRYLQEVDIVASVTTPTDQGVAPLAASGDLATLDWRGVAFVEEDWRPAADGTFTRQRFYRGARWMDQPSQLVLSAIDEDGRPVGVPIIAEAGGDSRHGPQGDFFVRRFVARQITTGCASVGDCSGARAFTAQGLAQLREALYAERRARVIPARATRLTLFWSADPHRPRSLDLSASGAAPALATGFDVDVAPLAPPANGRFYMPGETVSFRLTFLDGQGQRLQPEGQLPTYADFLAGNVTSGLRYFDIFLNPTLYYALKKREGNLLVTLSGPTDRLKVPKGTVPPGDFFLPQATAASVALDGFSAVVAGAPSFGVIFGGAADPTLWQTPVSDVVSLTVPADALPGTYVVAAKARRDFGGQALNRGRTLSLQVGTEAPTAFSPTTGRCTSCHEGPSALGNILHGVDDRRACFGCHPSLFFEPDNALDVRVHFVHSRSRRFPGDVNDCSLCHTTPPSGPARGFPPPAR